MRAHILSFVILLFCAPAHAQQYPQCSYKYFAMSKKVSTSVCYDKDRRWGRAKAFDKSGKEIYDRELRTVGGHSSVDFTYYDRSNAVKTARWSSAPDGGIQWYRSYTEFSEDGKIVVDTKDSYDDGPGTFLKEPVRRRPVVEPRPEEKPVPKPSTTMECAAIYLSEFWFTNHTPYTVVVTATRKFSKSETFTLSLKPKETLKAGHVVLAQMFDEPTKYFDFTVSPLKPGNKQKFIIIPSEKEPDNPSKETRRYYYEVRRII